MIFDFGLYPVITKAFCKNRLPIDILKNVIEAGVKIVQLREKNLPKNEIYDLALKFREITDKKGVKLIINDHIDIALAVNADGVHLGQEDLPCRVARKVAPDLIIGVSTHNFEEIKKAEIDGATYVNIGPIFDTRTKELSIRSLGLDYLRSVKTSLPFSVMGGIKKDNVISVIESGARNIAMVTEITEAPDVKKRTEEIIGIINNSKFREV